MKHLLQWLQGTAVMASLVLASCRTGQSKPWRASTTTDDPYTSTEDAKNNESYYKVFVLPVVGALTANAKLRGDKTLEATLNSIDYTVVGEWDSEWGNARAGDGSVALEGTMLIRNLAYATLAMCRLEQGDNLDIKSFREEIMRHVAAGGLISELLMNPNKCGYSIQLDQVDDEITRNIRGPLGEIVFSLTVWWVLHESAHHVLEHIDSTSKSADQARKEEKSADQARKEELAADEWAFRKMEEIGMPLLYVYYAIWAAEFYESLDLNSQPLNERASSHPSFETRGEQLIRMHPNLNRPSLDSVSIVFQLPEGAAKEGESDFVDFRVKMRDRPMMTTVSPMWLSEGIFWISFGDNSGFSLIYRPAEGNLPLRHIFGLLRSDGSYDITVVAPDLSLGFAVRGYVRASSELGGLGGRLNRVILVESGVSDHTLVEAAARVLESENEDIAKAYFDLWINNESSDYDTQVSLFLERCNEIFMRTNDWFDKNIGVGARERFDETLNNLKAVEMLDMLLSGESLTFERYDSWSPLNRDGSLIKR